MSPESVCVCVCVCARLDLSAVFWSGRIFFLNALPVWRATIFYLFFIWVTCPRLSNLNETFFSSNDLQPMPQQLFISKSQDFTSPLHLNEKAMQFRKIGWILSNCKSLFSLGGKVSPLLGNVLQGWMIKIPFPASSSSCMWFSTDFSVELS